MNGKISWGMWSIRKKIYIYIYQSGACVIVFMWSVAVRNVSGEERCGE